MDIRTQVAAQSGSMTWTTEELHRLFDRVAPASHWKNPINATVALATEREVEGTRQAVIFFTGSVPTIAVLNHGRRISGKHWYRVQAAGYYATIGA